MARKLIVEVLLDAQQFLFGLKRSSQATVEFERNLVGVQRQVELGSSAFRGLGRSLAFVTGGYVALDSASKFIGDSIQAARDTESANRSLAAQMKASGQSFTANRDRVAQTARSYAKFGFSSDEVTKSLATLERGSGSIDKSLKSLTLTADLARAKDMDLGSAASIVAKALAGQETGLRRNIPGLAKNLHGTQLLEAASRRMAGQAAANTDASQEFAAALKNTEEIIGQAILPTLNTYLGKLSKWLEDEKNQKRLQKDVNTVISDGATAFNDLAKAFGAVKTNWDKLPDWGGTKSKGLIDLLREIPGGNVSLLDLFGVNLAPTKPTGDVFKGISDLVTKVADAVRAAVAAAGRTAVIGARPLSLQGRFNLAELRLAQAQLTQTLADDRRILVVEKAIVEQQIKSAKSLKDKTKFTQQLVQITGQILSIDKQSAEAAKEKAQALKDQADAIKSAIIDQLQARQTANRDKSAIQDATRQLRTARAIGGPIGIRLATAALTDANLQAKIDKFQRLPARLTAGGQFTLGNVITINVHGVTDPEKVAKEVDRIIRRRNRGASPSSRGASAGDPAGAPR